MWVPNLAADTHLVRGSLAVEAGLRSAMGFPIWIGSEVHGVMTFFSREPSEPDETLLQMMTTIGSQIGAFIQRQKAEADLRATHADLEATVARRTGQLAKMNSALRAEVAERRLAEDSLQRLSTRLLRIQDEERQRLARELHDSTAQSLAALAMSLAVVRERRDALDDRARKALDESDLLADLCSREIRSMSYLLHPPFLQEVGLPAALRWCAEGFSRRSGIDVAVDVPDDFGRLAPDVETALYRVAQECLANVQRHSGSTQAWIQLARTDRGTTLQVRDHGRGMPAGILQRPDAVESLGVGLLGMRERVRQLGGHLRIVTGEQGTVIEVEIDLPQGEA
jgi:signal transduction histidine kinase